MSRRNISTITHYNPGNVDFCALPEIKGHSFMLDALNDVPGFLDSESNQKTNPIVVYERQNAHYFHVKCIETCIEAPSKRLNLIDHPILVIENLSKKYSIILAQAKFQSGAVRYRLLEALKLGVGEKFTYYDFLGNIDLIIEAACLGESPDDNELVFLAAMSEFAVYASNDFRTTTQHYYIPHLLADERKYAEFIEAVLGFTVEVPADFEKWFHSYDENISNIRASWSGWQTHCFERLLELKLKTVYYPGITPKIIDMFSEIGANLKRLGKKNTKKVEYSHLLSLLFNSNRPSQFSLLLDSIEQTTRKLNSIEIVLNIDDNDEVMEKHVQLEQSRRDIAIKYIKTPPPTEFCDLWKPINNLLDAVDENAYFVLVSSDEFIFKTQHWDSILEKYVGFFPDHIFRLKASRNRNRNYFDRWECNFLQDCIPFTTKRWFDISGNACPCFGPDGFQQAIAFYMSKHNQFSWRLSSRDIPINELHFGGDTPSIGVKETESLSRTISHTKALFVAQSYEMQLEASRRAAKLLCHIDAEEKGINIFNVYDDSKKSKMMLIEASSKKVIEMIDYSLPKWRMKFENAFRKFSFEYYFGLGREAQHRFPKGYAVYLSQRYRWFSKFKNLAKMVIYQIKTLPLRGIRFALRRPYRAARFIYRRLLKPQPQN